MNHNLLLGVLGVFDLHCSCVAELILLPTLVRHSVHEVRRCLEMLGGQDDVFGIIVGEADEDIASHDSHCRDFYGLYSRATRSRHDDFGILEADYALLGFESRSREK